IEHRLGTQLDTLTGSRMAGLAQKALGVVVAVENFGAGDILEVERPTGKRFMVPMNAQAVPEWGDRVVIDAEFVAAD
ncbi:MAG: PRC-barrel domain-containing protein, partial [Pseudorhodoplanes sp.]